MSSNDENQSATVEPQQAAEQTVFKEEVQSEVTEKKATMSGLDENIAGLLCYIFTIVTGIIFLIIEKENKFVRFHAMQAIFIFVFFFGLSLVLNIIPIIGTLISLLIAPVAFFTAVFLMYQAYQGKMYKLPFIGDLAEKHSVPK